MNAALSCVSVKFSSSLSKRAANSFTYTMMGCKLDEPPTEGRWVEKKHMPDIGQNHESDRISDSMEQNASIETIDKAAERRLRNKIDLRLVPVMCMLYLFCFIDRANVGKNPDQPTDSSPLTCTSQATPKSPASTRTSACRATTTT